MAAGAVAVLFGSSSPDAPVVAAAILVMTLNTLGALFALRALRPIRIYQQGWRPAEFAADLHKSEPEVLAEVISGNATRIAENARTSAELAKWSSWSISALGVTPLIAFAGAAVFTENGWMIAAGAVALGAACAVVYLAERARRA